MPKVRVEQATPTWLFFPTEIAKSTLTVDGLPRTVDKAALQVDGAQLRIVDVGERSVIVQAVEDLQPGERHELAVSFADGRAPARAAFALVTDPAEVDSRIDVERPEPPDAACPAAAPRDPPRPEDFVLLGHVDKEGVQAGMVRPAEDEARGLGSRQGWSYRGARWALVDVTLWNSAGQRPWTAHEATLTGRGGVTLRARLVPAGSKEIAPGGTMRLLAVVDSLPRDMSEVFALELRGSGGRNLVIPDVRFSGYSTEGQQ